MERNNVLIYEDYRKILEAGVQEYLENGGSIDRINTVQREYVFSYDDINIPYDCMEYLTDKAVQAINAKRTLPIGIRLNKCIYRMQKAWQYE